MSDRAARGSNAEASVTPWHGAVPPRAPVSATEAAVILGVNERTIRRAIARGELTAVKRGRAFVITPAALDDFRERRGGADTRTLPSPPPFSPAALTVLRTPVAADRRSRAGLPSPLARLIAREAEVDAIVRRLRRDDLRLVTLTGPGGVGKTRLALQAAREVAPAFADGARFVSFADVPRPSLLLSTIAAALGIREAPGRSPAAALAIALRGRSLLLVLDNLEHLEGPAIAADLAEILRACPDLKLLATSRSPVRLSGEHRFVIPPLALPEPGATPDVAALADFGAIALFVERARQVRPDFALDSANAEVVLQICRHLDGLPLALELAAAWLRALPPEALLQRLERRLPVLIGGAADQPARLQTMRDAIAWSHDLLSPEEARLFRRLSVFAGGCTLAGVEGVAASPQGVPLRSGGEGERGGRREDESEVGGRRSEVGGDRSLPPPASTLDLIAALIDKSLVQAMEARDGEPRFRLLETVREYALEQLIAHGEEAAMRAAHAAYYLALAEAAANAAERVGSGDWLRRLMHERPNLRAALDWFEQSGDSNAALQMAGALWHFWYRLGDFAEGRARLERALAAAPTTADPIVHTRALRGAGVLAWQRGEYDASRERLEAALANARDRDDRVASAWVRNSLGCLSATLADHDRAADEFRQALAIFSDVGDAVGIAQLTANLGELAERMGEHNLAIALVEAAIARWHGLNDRVGAARAQVVLAHALLARHETARAEAVLRDALATIRDNDYEQILPAALRAAAQLAVRRGDPVAGARWYGAEERVREILAVASPGARREGDERALSTARETLGPAAFATAWAAGHRLSAAQVIAEVLAGLGIEAGHDAARTEGLSPREQDVLRLLAAGQTDRQIADALFITRRTASKHVSAILAKLGVASRTAAVAVAHRDGLA